MPRKTSESDFHTKVDSRNLHSVSFWKDKGEGVLEITFNSGRTYQYQGVPRSVVTAMVRARSVGKAFNANVLGVYPYKEV